MRKQMSLLTTITSQSLEQTIAQSNITKFSHLKIIGKIIKKVLANRVG